MEPAQDLDSDLGKIIRMSPDGSGARVWTYGHRNPLGIAFDADGNLWNSEMGPQGGDELNLVREECQLRVAGGLQRIPLRRR